MIPTFATARDFVRDNTLLEAPSLVPEIRLHLASSALPLWEATEAQLEQQGLPPPYWAFAWAGGQALARYMLDFPEQVRNRRVLDFAAGSGIGAIAAAKAGARSVEAAEIDAFAQAAIAMNGAANGVEILVHDSDLVGQANQDWDLVLAGDVCYEQPMAARVFDWLALLAGSGATVLLGDPGRSYLPRQGLEKLTTYKVPTTRELEDCDLRNAGVWKVEPLRLNATP